MLGTISIGWQTCLLLTVKLPIMLEDANMAKYCTVYTCIHVCSGIAYLAVDLTEVTVWVPREHYS